MTPDESPAQPSAQPVVGREGGPSPVPALTGLPALGQLDLEQFGDADAGYCADGVCYLPAEQPGQPDVDPA